MVNFMIFEKKFNMSPCEHIFTYSQNCLKGQPHFSH